MTTAADRIRLAELAVESDRRADPALLTAAANDAIALADLSLSERFARSALSPAGASRRPDILVRALVWQGEVDEVERTLSAFDPGRVGPDSAGSLGPPAPRTCCGRWGTPTAPTR